MSAPSSADWVEVTAALVQHADYNANCAFGRVLITFDPAHRHDLFFLERSLSRVLALRGQRSLMRDDQAAFDLVCASPDKSRWQRWQLPASITENVPVYLCELPLFFNLLPFGEDSLSRPGRELSLLPCRAKPNGGIELLPYAAKDLQRREDEFVRLVAQNGMHLTAARVQANGDLYRPGTRSLPGLVLITFDASIAHRDHYLRDLAQQVYDLKEKRPRNEDEREVREIVLASERAGVLYRRRRLPDGFTGGRVVYAADLIIRPRYLKQGYLTDAEKMLPCVAEIGPSGAIEQLPYWDAAGESPNYDPHAETVAGVPEVLPITAGDEIDVTDVVLGPPQPVPVVPVEPEPPRSAPPLRRKRPIVLILALVLILFGGPITCVGGGALWYFVLRSPVALSNLRPVTLLGLRQGASVDYNFRHGPDPKQRYHIVVRNNRTGQSVRTPITFSVNQARGTLTVGLPTAFNLGLPQKTDYDFYLEAEPADGSGSAERVSNIIVISI